MRCFVGSYNAAYGMYETMQSTVNDVLLARAEPVGVWHLTRTKKKGYVPVFACARVERLV